VYIWRKSVRITAEAGAMKSLRQHLNQQDGQEDSNADPSVNPHRTAELFAPTAEGYLIAQDIACQYEYVQQVARCAACGSSLRVAGLITRAALGLNEIVCICTACQARTSLTFDISNAVYQTWLAGQMGDFYSSSYNGPPRKPVDP
jgi:hypothetical protein